MKKKIIIAVILVGLMIIVDSIINPSYLFKSGFKIVLFLLIPLLLSLRSGFSFIGLFKIKNKKDLIKSIGLGLLVYLLIILAYFILSRFIDLNNIRKILEDNLKVNRENFILVAVYISFINSLIEEFFFRGYLFLDVLKKKGRLFAHILSAGIFSIYHVGLLGGWFNPIIFATALVGLFIGGLIFNFLNEKNENILSSYLVHMMANLGINTIGLIMFNII